MPTGRMGSMIPLFIDCDPGIDDAIALGYALCQEDVLITGVAASGGNVPTGQVVRNALGWLALAGRADVPVHPGADLPLSGEAEYAEDTHGDTGTGYAVLPQDAVPDARDAARAWVEAARAHPGELVGVLLGPATNLALALEIEPRLPALIRRLFVMGGAFNYRGNTRPTTEWNISCDPEAAARVFAAFGRADSLPVIGPLEATEAVVMTPERLDAILGDGTGHDAAGNAVREPGPRDDRWQHWLEQLAAALRFYFEFHESDGHGYLAHIHDPYVLAAAIGWARAHAAGRGTADDGTADDSPDRGADGIIPWAETARVAIDVELHGTLTRGETVADWLGRWNRTPNAEVIRRIDAGGFLEHLQTVLMRGPTS